ncbi:glycosyltransferase 87 family protein [Corynebacterium mastitidis]|uniref:Glycosyltransferase 87 family protein n=1 Tax=Corynebacterium mastitidis TaxID=161890 RepID=A0ABU8NW21_9CORY
MRSFTVCSPAILALAAFAALINALLWSTQGAGADLHALWNAGELVRTDRTYDLYDASAYRGKPFFALPLLAAIVAPLTAAVPLGVAQFLLAAAQGCCLVLFLASAYYFWAKRPAPLAWLAPAATLAWFSAAFQIGSANGSLMPLALAATAWALAVAPTRPARAGVALGAASALALVPLVLVVPLLLWPKTRLAGAWAVVCAGAAVVLSALFAGLNSVRSWVGLLRDVAGGAVLSKENQAFSAIIMGARESLPRGVSTRVLADSPDWVHLIALLTALLLAAAACWLAGLRRAYAQEILLVGWLCAACLASPLLWVSSLLVLVLPLVGVLTMVRARRYQDALWTPLALVAPLLFWPLASTTSFEDDGMGLPWGGLLAAFLVSVLFLLAAAAPSAWGAPAAREERAERDPAPVPTGGSDPHSQARTWYRLGTQASRDFLSDLPTPGGPHTAPSNGAGRGGHPKEQ